MAEIWKENTAYKVVAVLLAILLWFYVTADQNPPIDKTLNLNVNYENLDEGLILTYKSTSISVKVRGNREIINSLGEKDFQATVDLSQVEMGEYTLPVKVAKPARSEIVEIYPKEVKINVDKVAEKQVPVNVALLGQTAHGYSSFKASVKPSQIVIRGPEKTLENIVEARADINLNGAKGNLTLNLPVKLQDSSGDWYGTDTFEIIPSSVEVFVPIVEDTPSKTVPIRPNFIGEPAPGYQVARVLVEPETVKVLGSFDNLNTIDRIQTMPVNLTNTSEDITIDVDLSVPSEVTLLYGTKVKVMVQIEEAAVQKDFELLISINNSKENQKVSLAIEKIKVRVEGKQEVISKLSNEDFEVFVDVAGVETGTHELEIQVDAPSDVKILQIDPATVEAEVVVETENQNGNKPGTQSKSDDEETGTGEDN